MVDDGSDDGSWDEILHQAEGNSAVHGIRFRRNYGKSAALYCGFEKAQGDVVFTMDADLQDFPEEIPEMYRMVKDEGWDIVSGWKQKRQDNALTKNLPSKLYNATARRITGKEIPAKVEPRRAGDPSVLIASNKKAAEVLGWKPTRGLEQIIADAWTWHSTHPGGYEG